MEFCTNCGAPLNDAPFCTNCGTSAGANQTAPDTTPMTPPTSGVPEMSPKNQNIIKIVVVAVIAAIVIGVVVGIVSLFGGNSPEGVAKDFVKATLKGDAKKIVSLMPDKYVDYMVEEEGYDSKKELIEEGENELEKAVEFMEEELGVKASDVKIKVDDVDDIDEDVIESMNERYEDVDMKIKEGKKVTLEMTIPIEDDEKTTTNTINVYKVGSKWCVLDF